MPLSDELADWDRFRDLIHLLARQVLRESPGWRVDSSDLAQDALLRAFRAREECRATSEAGFRAWLYRILENQLHDTRRTLLRAKRDVRRERSMASVIEQSSLQLEKVFCDPASSPSHKASRNEELYRVATALQNLPDHQREAIELHYLQHCSFAEVAQRMELSRDQVAGLIRRGIQRLRGSCTVDSAEKRQ